VGNLSTSLSLPKPTSFGYDGDSSQKYAIFGTIRPDEEIATKDNIRERQGKSFSSTETAKTNFIQLRCRLLGEAGHICNNPTRSENRHLRQ
jgi:hypothetical protein